MIGGEHHLRPPGRVQSSLAAVLEHELGPLSLFATGRDALFALLHDVPQRTVHVPDLICHSVVQACEAAGKRVCHYAVPPDLLSAQPAITGGGDECVLVMHYFGVVNEALALRARAAGAVVVSDATHLAFDAAALGVLARASDHVFGSLRKSGPFPDGAFLASRLGDPAAPARPMREEFVVLRAAALLSRGFSARSGYVDDENFGWLRRAEALLDASPPADHACSYLGRELLTTVECETAAQQMRANAQVLEAVLDTRCVLPCRGAAASPYFYVRFASREQRDAVRAGQASRRIFLPVHWDTRWSACPSPLSDLGLSIPCVARYGVEQMRSTAEAIVACLS